MPQIFICRWKKLKLWNVVDGDESNEDDDDGVNNNDDDCIDERNNNDKLVKNGIFWNTEFWLKRGKTCVFEVFKHK